MEERKELPPKKSPGWQMFLWLLGFLAIVGGIFCYFGIQVYEIDPYFHYRAPDTDTYFYELSNERCQNDGILKYFDYDALIIGTSMCDNFKTSEFDELFGVNSVKCTFAGGTFRETGDRLKTALEYNDDLKLVVRSLDMDFYFMDYDDLGDQAEGDYPDYLYDDSVINDFKYLLNRDVIFGRVETILNAVDDPDVEPGYTSFDRYANWTRLFNGQFGSTHVIEEELWNNSFIPYGVSDSDKMAIKRNIQYNILDIAEAYPDVEFYYFIPPYSAVWWNAQMTGETIIRQLQAEQYIIEMLLPYENIHIFSFNHNFEMTGDLNNYKDAGHYGEWINSAILIWMNAGLGELTEDNYQSYLQTVLYHYAVFDFTTLNDQEDVEDDLAYGEQFLEQYFSDNGDE